VGGTKVGQNVFFILSYFCPYAKFFCPYFVLLLSLILLKISTSERGGGSLEQRSEQRSEQPTARRRHFEQGGIDETIN
jgi:hypothetical protein